MSQVQISDAKGNRLPVMHYTVSLSENPDEPYVDDYFTDYAGSSSWPRMGMPRDKPLFLHVNYYNKQAQYEYQKFPVAAGYTEDVQITLANIVKAIQEVSIRDDKFYTEDGLEFKWMFGSNFSLAHRVAEGQDIAPLLYDGLNGYRIFGTYANIADQMGMKRFHPKEYPNWLQAIEVTFDILAEHGKYGQLNLLCDMQMLPYDLNEQRNLHNQVCEMLRRKKNKFYSLGNENFKNGFNADDFDEPSGIICACGSGGTGDRAPLSRGRAWRIQHQHLRRDIKMFIDIPPIEAPTYNLGHMVIFDETIGYADFNRDNARTNNTDWAYKMGRIMSAFNGGVIHLESGGHSYPLGMNGEAQSVSEFVRAFRA